MSHNKSVKLDFLFVVLSFVPIMQAMTYAVLLQSPLSPLEELDLSQILSILLRVFKNRLKYDLKSNQIICPEYDLKSQSNSHFPKRYKIKIKSNRFTQWPIILVFLVRLSFCIIILKMLKSFFNFFRFLWQFTYFHAVY
jgi:hypothetical protein